MKVSVVVGLTPTQENRGGISALPYSLLKYRPSDIELKIYTFNMNKISVDEIKYISNQLNAPIEILNIPYSYQKYKKNVWLQRYDTYCRIKPLEERLFNKDLIERFRQDNSDFILLYPFYMSCLAEMMPDQRFVISGPDCDLLVFTRMLGHTTLLTDNKLRRTIYLRTRRTLYLERKWNAPNTKVHFVGMEDYDCYKRVLGFENAHFILHPHSKIMKKQIDFSRKRLKVIMAGSNNFYMENGVNEMIRSLIKYKETLLETYDFTFLGKGWNKQKQLLDSKGFTCHFKEWVDDYIEELVNYDIQLSPVYFGTGAKGKVLDALANGLLVIGSTYAFENICVRNMDSCVWSKHHSDIAQILISISNNRQRYQQIAEKGRQQVLTYHNPERISRRFFEIYYNEFKKNK